jgi:DNA recombination-dependent growth factor C
MEFNPTAYNAELFSRWISEEFAPAIADMEVLLVMDVASFHKTDDILNDLRKLLQPLDTAINAEYHTPPGSALTMPVLQPEWRR